MQRSCPASCPSSAGSTSGKPAGIWQRHSTFKSSSWASRSPKAGVTEATLVQPPSPICVHALTIGPVIVLVGAVRPVGVVRDWKTSQSLVQQERQALWHGLLERRRRMKAWISGQPAPFATAGERSWKDGMAAQVPAPFGEYCVGIVLNFSLRDDHGWPGHPDIDNLCEPVFSTVINRLRWFGGSRTRLVWYLATKHPGADVGALISLTSDPAPEVASLVTAPSLAATWSGDQRCVGSSSNPHAAASGVIL
jgi:hypothetical protein